MQDPLSPITTTPVRHGVLAYFRTDVYVGRCLELYGEHSPGEIRLFAALLGEPRDEPDRGMIVAEAGAHVGDHTLALAKLVGPRGKVYAFEPQEALAGLLLTNLAMNAVNGWTFVVPVALGDGETEEAFFPEVNYFAPGNFGGVSLRADGTGSTVVSQALDNYGLDHLDLLKIDVEGMELALLRGAETTIKAHQPIIYLENDRVEKSADLIEWLTDEVDYKLWWHLPRMIDKDNYKGKISIVYPNMTSINMLALPAEGDVDGALASYDIEERDRNRMWPVLGPDDRPDNEYGKRLMEGTINDA